MGMLRVLVIEDDEWVADLLVAALRDASFAVETASTAGRGLELAAQFVPDCIVCDFALSDRDGVWFARQLRASEASQSTVPLLLVSSRDEPDASCHGFAAGVDAFMAKPFRLDEVIAQVKALIAFAARFSAAAAPATPPSGRGGRVRRERTTAGAPEASSPPESVMLRPSAAEPTPPTPRHAGRELEVPASPPSPPSTARPSSRAGASILSGPPTSVSDLLPPSSRWRGP